MHGILRYRKKIMLFYAITGACIAGIPLALLLLFQSCRNVSLVQQIDSYKELEKEKLYITVWTVKKDIAAGEKIARSDLEKEQKWIPKTCNVSQMMDIKQIAGRKAKTALKKGTIMHTDLLYSRQHLSDEKSN